MKSLHQINTDNYHDAIKNMHHGHNMHIMHRDWHQENINPNLIEHPQIQSPNWSINERFGTNFLQMHHEMIKARPIESPKHMEHASIAEWYFKNGLSLPSLWNPLNVIPEELGYEPDPSVYPDEIRIPIEEWARSEYDLSIKEFLTRRSDNPSFELPKYFTLAGVSNPLDADPYTGAMRLSDFVNTNQLGCSLVFPHDLWHVTIGGAMSTTWTAIADPVFYFGVHWHIDLIFDEFKLIEKERQLESSDSKIISKKAKALNPRLSTRKDRNFTDKEKSKIALFFNASKAIRGPSLNR